MPEIEQRCKNCIYCEIIQNYKDEPSDAGCTKPGWESYVYSEHDCCGFFVERKEKLCLK